MSKLASKVREGVALLRGGEARVVWDVMRHRLHADSTRVELRRDLATPVPVPEAKIPVTVRPMSADDRERFLSARKGLDGAEEHEWWLRERMLAAGLKTCYVAVDPQGQLTYMQWLMPARQNDVVHRHYRGLFPRLRPDEALLEGAYTFPAFRGLRIMAHVMAQIAEQAADLDARSTVTFVAMDNEPSLKGCERAGFVRYALWHDRWRVFRRSSMRELLEVADEEADATP